MTKRPKTIILAVSGVALLGVVVIIASLLAGCGLSQVNCSTCGIPGPTECVAQHILENRPDILAAFAQKGWDTSRSNWKAIVTEWSQQDPAAYLTEYNLSAPQCEPPDPPIEPSKESFNINYLIYLASFLNPTENWNNYCTLSTRWNPLSHGAMPCTTWVSTIWYLSGVKDVDVKETDDPPMYDKWSWYSPKNQGASLSWQNGECLYNYVATYYPQLLTNAEVDDSLFSPQGMLVTVAENTGPEKDLTLDPVKVREAGTQLRTGDILQFFGSLKTIVDGKEVTEERWKHTVLVVAAPSPDCPYYTPRIASFGRPEECDFPWDDIANEFYKDREEETDTSIFDFWRVRAIHLPSSIPLQQNLVKNPSIEHPVYDPNYDARWGFTKWITSVPGANGTWTVVPDTRDMGINTASTSPHYGYRFLFHKNASVAKTIQTVAIPKDGAYLIKAFVRNRSGNNDIYILNLSNNTPSYYGITKIPDTTEWDEATAYHYFKQGDYEIGLYSAPNGTENCDIDIDDIQVFFIE